MRYIPSRSETYHLTHRRADPQLPDHVLFFHAHTPGDAAADNAHYGEYVWVLKDALPPVPADVIRFAADYYGTDLDEAESLVDPARIVDDAGAWEDPQFAYAVWDRFGEPVGYATRDGAVVLDRHGVELEPMREDAYYTKYGSHRYAAIPYDSGLDTFTVDDVVELGDMFVLDILGETFEEVYSMDRDEVRAEAEAALRLFRSLPDPIVAYRVVGAQSPDHVVSPFGASWSLDRQAAIAFATAQHDCVQPFWLLRGEIPQAAVDWALTLGNWMVYSTDAAAYNMGFNEQEIALDETRLDWARNVEILEQVC